MGILFLAGCDKAKPPAPAAAAGQPMPVVVALPIERDVQDYEEFTGRTAAQYSVEVRARVTGYLDKILFQDGAEIKSGEPLFLIDPRPFKAAKDAADALIAVRKAAAVFRETEFKRDTELVAKNAVSRSEYDRSAAAFEEAKAMVSAAEADAEIKNLNLAFTDVRAAIDGRLSDRKIDVGNLVVADQTLLTSIVSVDPMYVLFDIDERRLLRIREQMREGKIRTSDGVKIPIEMALDNEAGFPNAGEINFSDNRIEAGTGTIRLRAVVPNPKPEVGARKLVPGMFARIRVPLGEPRKSVLVADAAIGSDQGQKYVYVVDASGDVAYRRVRTGRTDGGLRIVEEGLMPGEWVIVAGVQRVKPGVKVAPKQVEMTDYSAASTMSPKSASPTSTTTNAAAPAAPQPAKN